MPESTPVSIGDIRWWTSPEIDATRLRALALAMDAALAAGAENRKHGRRKQSFLLALEGPAPDYLVKLNHYAKLAPWKRVRRSKARAELARASVLAAAGIPTLVPVAAGEVRRAGLLDRCYGLVRWLPDAVDLLRVWTEARDDARSRRSWTRELGALVRRMHDAGVHQEDLAPNNFLWRKDCEPHLLAIDFERARVGGRVADRERVFALAKLDRHFAGARAAARMRLLSAYTGGDRGQARRWWREIAAFAPQLTRRDLAHWQRTAAKPGRRFDVLELDVAGVVWRGFARRNAPLETLRDLLARDVAESTPLLAGAPLVRRIEVPRERDAAAVWGLAQTLYQRRLMPEPLALLRGSDVSVLALSHADDLEPLTQTPLVDGRAALVVAIDRLLGFGFDVHRLRAPDLVFSRQLRTVLLLDPTRCAFAQPERAGGRAAARARALALLG